MKVLDLFSGIGGFSLGLERAGMETVAFCEFDKHAQKVLKKHWPDVPIHDDVRTLDGKQYRGSVDVVCGGFPCQDLSLSGLGEGFKGDRSSLYIEQIRVIKEVKPKWAIFENVDGLFSREGGSLFGQFLSDLAEIGLDAEWHTIRASDVGAWHKRSRKWIVAYPTKELRERGGEEQVLGEQRLQIKLCRGFERWPGRHNLPQSRLYRDADGISGRTHRLNQLGNAVVPQIPEAIGRAIMANNNAQ